MSNKVKIYIYSLLLLLFGTWGCAEANNVLTHNGGDIGKEAMEDLFDPDSWFAINEIDSLVFSRIKGKSYKDDCTVPLDELRYITMAHYGADGEVLKGELICNKAIAEDLLDIFRNLYKAQYPIESIRLIDEYDADDVKSMQANNTSCFNYRVVAGSKKLSKHATGMAIDINPLYNPYVRSVNGKTVVSPPEAEPYSKRTGEIPFKIDTNDLCYKEFIAHGFTWGGAWKSLKDYQHFEK